MIELAGISPVKVPSLQVHGAVPLYPARFYWELVSLRLVFSFFLRGVEFFSLYRVFQFFRFLYAPREEKLSIYRVFRFYSDCSGSAVFGNFILYIEVTGRVPKFVIFVLGIEVLIS